MLSMGSWNWFLQVLEDPLLIWAVWFHMSYSISLNLSSLIWNKTKVNKWINNTQLQVAFILPFSEVLLLNFLRFCFLHNGSFSEVLFFHVWIIQLGKIQMVKSMWKWRSPPCFLYDRLIIVCLMYSTNLAVY